jgi:ankyrin repeat protein
MKQLLAHKADPNRVGQEHHSALHMALNIGSHSPFHISTRLEMVKVLLDAKADPLQRTILGQNALLYATNHNFHQAIPLLLPYMSFQNINLTQFDGDTALHLASKFHTHDYIIPLLQLKANPQALNYSVCCVL